MKIAPLIKLLGMSAADEPVLSALAALGTVATPALDKDEPDQHFDWILVRKKGVELGFADTAYFLGRPMALWRHDGLMLNQLTFYSDSRNGVAAYSGELPHGLLMSDSRAIARGKMQSFEPSRHSYQTDRWNVGDYRVIVAYRAEGLGIDSVHLKLPIRPFDEKLRRQPTVPVHQWSRLFGHPAASKVLRDALTPLDLLERIKDGEDEREVEFLGECGMTLYFEHAERLGTAADFHDGHRLVLGGVKFHRARDLESRQYTGELPFGLSFDDSPEQLNAKIGTEPVRRIDGRMTGRALWHLPSCSLQVLYSTIENDLFRVMLMAPGYWQEMAAMA